MSLGSLRAAALSRLELLGPWPISAPLVRASLIAPRSSGPSERLLDVAQGAIAAARGADVSELAERLEAADPPAPAERSLLTRLRGRNDGVRLRPRPDRWPGEHYKLLVGLVGLLAPKLIVELGTATGLSAIAMRSALPPGGRIVTFDVLEWNAYPNTVLTDADFADGRIEQRCEDLSTSAGLSANAQRLREADFIFVDALHDGEQERRFVRGFDQVGLERGPIVMFDDIRLWRMLGFWREIARPKLDLTSFGHWSGTGLVDFA
ncbi:MAG TPA: class I SAM-dependent methyltransferase [Solirubrobacteraceae bacterium]|jgi:predicted O-methyltransferase YrrM|nr:class I SAM-dependent methyltransferase [Solirubrobacteraceae bacterium]